MLAVDEKQDISLASYVRICTGTIEYLDLFSPARSWNVKKPPVPLPSGGFGEAERGVGATSGLHISHQIVI